MREVALILNMNKPYDRKVIRGVSSWIREHHGWNLYLEDDSLSKIPELASWQGDGIIADFDDPRVVEAMQGLAVPVVGLGGGYQGEPRDAPTVYYDTDNEGIARLAAEHFLERGFIRFAYCGTEPTGYNRWSQERGDWFAKFVGEAGFSCSSYTGGALSPRQWGAMQAGLVAWLKQQIPPFALLACNDARARHVLVACRTAGLRVPEDVAVLGVDNDETVCELALPPLSSVAQGTDRLGYEAAMMLDKLMNSQRPEAENVIIPPVGVVTRQSTDITAIEDPLVAAALAYIAARGCDCIQVVDVANATNCSRSALEKKFRATLNRSVHAEIQRIQMRRVEELLLHSTVPLKEIAHRAGFSSVQYMSTTFRTWSGLTPAIYRKQRGK